MSLGRSFLVAAVLVTADARAVTVEIAEGDVAGLLAALPGAGPEFVDIKLAPRGTYELATDPPNVTGHVRLDGRGSVVTTTSPAGTIRVEPGAQLHLEGIRFRKISVDNGGHLTIDRSSFADARPFPFLRYGYAGVITNDEFGSLWITNTTFHGMRALGVTSRVAVVMNHGNAYVRHATFEGNKGDGEWSNAWGPPTTLASFPLGTGHPGTLLRIQNSIVADSVLNACGPSAQYIESDGGNIFDDSSCALAADDRIATPDFGTFGEHGGDPDSVPIASSSPAIDSASANGCLPTDARGLPRIALRCDAGAFERVASTDGPNQDGLNGVWMSAAGDGQYVTLQRVSEMAVLVVWFGFDAQGGNSLVYGVGTLQDRTVLVSPASRSANGHMQPNGIVVGATVAPWGVLRAVVSDCGHATLFHRASASPEEITLPLVRLASVHGIGCLE